MYLEKIKLILKKYKPKTEVSKYLNETQLVLITSVTSVGKNTVINNLVNSGGYYNLISDTTRSPRINDGLWEINGQDYWFVDEKFMLEKLNKKAYIEAAIVHKNHVYGIGVNEIIKAKNAGLIAVTDIDIVGCGNLNALSSTIKSVFLLPPNYEEWMRRLNHRGKMDQKEKTRRLETALKELSAALEKDYFTFFVNTNISNTANDIENYVKNDYRDSEYQKRSRELAKKLIARLNKDI